MDILSKNTPRKDYPDDPLQGKPKPSATDINPATGQPYGKIAKGKNKGKAAVSPDHIVPKPELVQMPGFTKLTPDQQWWLFNTPFNLAWLGVNTNLKKGSRDVTKMTDIEEEWQRQYKQLQDEKRRAIQDIIDRFVEANGY